MQRDEEKNLQSQSANMTYSSNLKNVLNLWPRLNALETEFLLEIYMIMTIKSSTGDTNKDVFIIVKKDGDVYSYGFNQDTCGISSKENDLSFSEIMNRFNNPGNPKIIENLCGKSIKTFIQNYKDGLFLLTNEGEVYSCGDNRNYTLGHKESDIISKLTLVTKLSDKNIVDIVCGIDYTLALTVDGKVYTWGKNIFGQTGDSISEWQTPKQIKSELENKKIVCIACGSSCSMVVTDNGEVYSWGSMFKVGFKFGDTSKQQYLNNDWKFNSEIPARILSFTDNYSCSMNRITFSAIIVKVACGLNHALALTDQGDLYTWGKNGYGQLGTGNRTDIYDPVLLNTSNMGKLSDIAALSMKNISVAVNENGCFYVWGLYANCEFLTPHATVHTNMNDVFASENIMYKPLILSADGYECVKKESNIMRYLKDAFDDPSTSDFKVQVKEQDIHVHKAILKICSSHFRSIFQHDSTKNTENILKDNMFSYNVYKTYLKYLYTGVIDIPQEESLELLKLADMYGETNLKTDCIPIIRRGITISNVALFYSKAIDYNEKRLEEFCFSFALKCLTEVVQTDSFIKLDEGTKTMFIIKAAKANAFKT